MRVFGTKLFTICLLSLALLLSGCTASGTDTNSTSDPSSRQTVSTATVKKRQIVPTFSSQASVEQASSFVISTSQRGAFKAAVKVSDSVKAGQSLGWNNGAELFSPVDATVRSIADAANDLPANYPIFELEYKGFALELEAPSLLSVAPIESLTGKFQISGGLGPADVLAIVSAPSIQEPENGNLESDSADSHSSVDGEPMGANLVKNGEESLLKDPVAVENNVAQIPRPRISSQKLLCLIGKDQPVRPGQTATVVLSGKAKTDVLAAPVNAVAGRVGKGSVTLFKDGAPSIIEVGLGISDGAYIEITSGLSEGDVISNAAPYLDPRKK